MSAVHQLVRGMPRCCAALDVYPGTTHFECRECRIRELEDAVRNLLAVMQDPVHDTCAIGACASLTIPRNAAVTALEAR